jgi:hypothetical protein
MCVGYANTDFLTAPIEWTSVPFPVKALKIILSDLQNQHQQGDASGPARSRADDIDLDSDDEVRMDL